MLERCSRALRARDRFRTKERGGASGRRHGWNTRRNPDDHQVFVPLRGPRRSGRHGPGRDPGERPPLSERAPHHGVLEDRGACEVDGPARLRHPVARRAPLPARRLRVHPEHPHAGGASRACDQAPADRLRFQHLPDVAPAAPRRGLRHRGHPHRRAGDLRGRARLPHPGGRDPRRRPDGPGAQPGDVRRAGQHHVQGVQRGALLPPGPALHHPPEGSVPRLRARGAHPGAAPEAPAGGVW